jgi:hypothetical protein
LPRHSIQLHSQLSHEWPCPSAQNKETTTLSGRSSDLHSQVPKSLPPLLLSSVSLYFHQGFCISFNHKLFCSIPPTLAPYCIRPAVFLTILGSAALVILPAYPTFPFFLGKLMQRMKSVMRKWSSFIESTSRLAKDVA